MLSHKVDGILNASVSTIGVWLGQGMPLGGQGHGLQFWGCQPAHSMVKVPFQPSLPRWQKWAFGRGPRMWGWGWVPAPPSLGWWPQPKLCHWRPLWDKICMCMYNVHMIIIYLSKCIFLFSYVYTRSALGLILFSLDPTLFFKFFFLGSLNPHILISLSLLWNFSSRTVSEA